MYIKPRRINTKSIRLEKLCFSKIHQNQVQLNTIYIINNFKNIIFIVDMYFCFYSSLDFDVCMWNRLLTKRIGLQLPATNLPWANVLRKQICFQNEFQINCKLKIHLYTTILFTFSNTVSLSTINNKVNLFWCNLWIFYI